MLSLLDASVASRVTRSERGEGQCGHNEPQAERMIEAGLAQLGLRREDLADLPREIRARGRSSASIAAQPRG